MSIIFNVIEWTYSNTIREFLPKTWAIFAGVAVREARWLDLDPRYPEYKRGLIEAIHENIDQGDHATIIGLGRGVSTVHMLRAGATNITAYEAAGEMIDVAKETIETNCVVGEVGKVIIKHQLVSDEVQVYGDDIGEFIPASELPRTEVLVMDCEGAELGILKDIVTPPKVTIVETHPEQGVCPDAVETALRTHYESISSKLYQKGKPEQKRVLIAKKPL